MKHRLAALTLAVCALRGGAGRAGRAAGAAVDGDTGRRLTRGDGGFRHATPPPATYGGGEKKVTKKKKDSAIVIGVIAGAIAAVFLFILCAGCFMYYNMKKEENAREVDPLLPEPG
jgi:hypothetical protein